MAKRLTEILAAEHNIPAYPVPLPPGVAIPIFTGLVAWTNGRTIWWAVPDLNGDRNSEKPLFSYAHHPATAAARLAQVYAELRNVPLHELLMLGTITPFAATLLQSDHRGLRDATPI
jgi:hypothetical protein